MKFVLLYGLMILTLTTGSAQNYFDYHKKIIHAEELFLNDSLPKSLDEYKKIFSEYRPFAKDAYIALQLSCMINDTMKAKYFFEQSFLSGVNWKILKNVNHIYKLLNKYPDYKKTIRKLYEQNRKEYLNTIDISLKKYFIQLSHNDNAAKEKKRIFRQVYRSDIMKNRKNDTAFQNFLNKQVSNHPTLVLYKSKNHDSTSGTYQMIFRSIKKNYVPLSIYDTLHMKVKEDNIRRLDSISKKMGFVPGERTIGIFDHEYYNDKEASEILVPVTIHILYHHGCGFVMMKDELMESVRKGEIHPRVFAEIYTFSILHLKDKQSNASVIIDNNTIQNIKCNTPKMPCIDYQIANLEPPLVKYDTTKINQCRKELSISSIQHDQQKRAYAKKHHLILFFGILGTEM